MTNRNRKKLIHRYLRNKATSAELEVFFKELEDGEFVQLLASESDKIRSGRHPWVRRIAITASLAASLIIGFFFYSNVVERNRISASNDAALQVFSDDHRRLQVEFAGQQVMLDSMTDADSFLDSIISLATVDTIRLTAPVSSNINFHLPDGTHVYLNALSSIAFPKVFAPGERRVGLSGEAFFEVVSDKQNPFFVSTTDTPHQLDIRVTGTTFNVSAYADDAAAQVALLEGVVHVNEHLLKPGNQYSRSSGSVKVSPFDPDLVTAWVQGDFRFEDESILAILDKLERWYGVTFNTHGLDDKITFGGVISRDKKLDAILALLAKHTGVTFKKTNSTIYVQKKN